MTVESQGPMGRCSCSNEAVVRVNGHAVCMVCLPDELKAHRRRAVEARDLLEDGLALRRRPGPRPRDR